MIHTAVLLLAAVSATHGFSEMKADMQAMFDDVQNDEHNFQSSRLAPSHLPLPLAVKVLRIDKFWIFRYELSILIRMCSLSIVGYFWFPKVETCRIRIISVCTENMS